MNDVLNLARMARRLGVAQSWLREQALAGNLPCLRAGTRLLFHVDAVEAALAAQAANGKGDGNAKVGL